MANNRNEMVDSDINCTEQIDRFDYSSNIPNAPEGSSTSGNPKFFPKILKYLMRSTVRIIQNKKKKLNIGKRSVSTLRKSDEKITKCTSLSSIADKIKSDAGTTVDIEKKMIDAGTSTTRYGEDFDKVTHENLLGIVGHLVRDASHRYAKYTGNNAVQERSCGPLCVGIGTQSDTVNREFSMKTSPDAFAKACEERRHADLILGKIAKISDALTEEKARLVSVKEQASSILTSISVTSTRYQVEEETFERTKPLISSIIHAEEKPTTVAVQSPAATITVMQPETLTDSQVLIASTSSSDFASESQVSTSLDKSLSTSDIQVISPLEHLRKTEPTPTTSVMYPERDDFRDAEVATKMIKEEEESTTKISVPSTLDKNVETDYAAVIINCIPKLRRTLSKCLDLYHPKEDCQTSKIPTDKVSKSSLKKEKSKSIKDKVSKTSLKKEKSKPIKDKVSKTSLKKEKSKPIKDKVSKISMKKEKYKPIKEKYKPMKDKYKPIKEKYKPIKDKKAEKIKDKRKIKTIKDILSKPTPVKYKKPKYRAKYRIEVPPKIKEDAVSKKIWMPKEKLLTYGGLSLPSPKPIRTCRSFNYFEMYRDCRSKPLRCLQPVRHCENFISSNVCLGRSKYCDVWTVQCFNSQNDVTRNAYCRPLQDSCPAEYRASCHSLIDGHTSRYYNVNDCAEPRVTFGNSLYTNTYCKNDGKYCYPHLNNIDNVQMGYYHCNDSPVWDSNQHCGMDRSYCWTKGNLYFTHPWTSEHLL